MKRTKKLLALVLALMMAFSLMAVTAAAAGTEEHEHTDACSTETIEPKGVAMQCEYCGRGMLQVNSGKKDMLAFQCTNVECKHCGEIFYYPDMG